jgi:RNA polymerase sigma-70 factor (ECF subfamily)
MTGEVIAVAAAPDRPADAAERVAALFDAHHQRLFRLARRLSRDTESARDVVQETFLRAARSTRSVPEGPSHEEAWLVRVLINICRDRWRQAAVRQHHAPALAQPSASPHPEAALIARSLVRTALAKLPPRRRAILVMYELEGATIPAIGRLLGISAVTVRWHLSVGRREMARILGRRTSS